MKIAEKYDRRRFLRGIGAGAAMLPMLENEWARAAGGAPQPPRRFLSFVITNGMPPNKFFPTTAGAGYTNNEVCTPLDPVKDKVTFVDGLQFKSAIDAPVSVAGHHDLGAVLTGVPLLEYSDPKAICIAGGPSVDQYIVDKARLTDPTVPRPLLIAYKPAGEAQTSWRGARAPETAESDLYKLFNNMFMQSGSGAAPLVPAADLTKLRAARRSLLDVVGRDLQRFCKNLGSDDRDRCQSHLAAFREIESAFGMSPQTSASPLAAPTLTGSFSSTDNADMPKYMDALVKLIAAAFASNRAKCINFTFGDGIGDSLSYPHLGFPKVAGVSIYDAGSGVDHGEAHNNTKVHMAARKWLVGQFANLVTAMSKVIENNGKSLLDNSVLYLTPNMSTGGSHDVGRGINMPTLYAGSLGGYLKTGVSVKLSGKTATNRLFHAFFGGMGIDPTGFDQARYGTELTEVKA